MIIYSLLTVDRLCLWAPESANRRPTGPTPAFILGLYWSDNISIVGCCSGGGARGGGGGVLM